MNVSDDSYKAITHYQSPLTLTVLTDKLEAEGMSNIGALEIVAGEHGGLVLFPSPLDAEIYRQRHATICSNGDHMRVCPLSDFDLLSYARLRRGRFACSLVFGFSASPSHQLTLHPGGDLQTILIPMGFNLPRDAQGPVNFRFNLDTMEHIESEWVRLGGHEHANALELANGWSADKLQAKAAEALARIELVSRKNGPGDHWTFYDVAARQWRFGLTHDARRQRIRPLPDP